MQTFCVWILGNLENRIISVERIIQYTRVKSEAALVIEDSRPPKEWPSQGNIDLHDLRVRYNDHSPYVLHGITCKFPGGKKIGVVGRTGSGKTTLIQTLFRIVEPSGGSVVIDGLDISKIGLHDLRNRLSIIPQDPTLFEGTIRANLDPLQQFSDDEIWQALEKCQLGDVVRAKPEKLECPVNEDGENWSVGQRQLVCLGRALLKRTTILVLDEATASVDTATDGVIQQTLRAEFEKCTVITVAHRIPTIINSDLALVLSDGKIAEYDQPIKLLQNQASLFYKLVTEYSKRSRSVNNLIDLQE
jgi:ABC-type multidrug transport system fused ATPase/permease subunit